MNAAAIAAAVIAAIETGAKIAPIAIEGIENAKVFATTLWQSVTGKVPTAEDEATIDALLVELSKRLEEPLPAAQPGDPDFVEPKEV